MKIIIDQVGRVIECIEDEYSFDIDFGNSFGIEYTFNEFIKQVLNESQQKTFYGGTGYTFKVSEKSAKILRSKAGN